MTASFRPCRSTPDRTSRPPSWSARATTGTASSRCSPRARRSRRRCWCGSCAVRLHGCAGPLAGRCSWAPGPARHSRWAWPPSSSRSAPSATIARSRWASRRRTGGRGWATSPSRRPSGRRSPASAPPPRSGSCAASARLVGPRQRPGRRLRDGLDLPGPGRPGSGLQPLHGAPRGAPRGDVLALAREAGVDVGQVYEVDASRRTTGVQRLRHGAGAHEARGPLRQPAEGLHPRRGPPRRRPRARPRALPRRAAGTALRRARGARRRSTRRRCSPVAWRPPSPGPVRPRCPALALSLAVVSIGVTVVANQLSRRIEARADSYSLRLTDSPEPFIGFERGIALRNVADPDPPGLARRAAGHAPAHRRPHRDRQGVRGRRALAGRQAGGPQARVDPDQRDVGQGAHDDDEHCRPQPERLQRGHVDRRWRAWASARLVCRKKPGTEKTHSTSTRLVTTAGMVTLSSEAMEA